MSIFTIIIVIIIIAKLIIKIIIIIITIRMLIKGKFEMFTKVGKKLFNELFIQKITVNKFTSSNNILT